MMSLKAVHVIFVSAALLLTAFFGVWAWREYASPEGTHAHLIYGVLSIVTFVGLLFYGKYFLKKLRHISYL
jgi:hypothetical protein